MSDLPKYGFTVLDKGYVELVDIMGNDTAIASAARASFNDGSKGSELDTKLIYRLMKDNHTSPFEMVEFKFKVKAPLMVCWQWFRHRTWSYSVQSGRYTAFDNNDFYIPTEWRKQSSDNKQASENDTPLPISFLLQKRMEYITGHCFDLYEQALKYGVAKEQARLFLPAFALYYTFYAKVDAHNLMHFLELRMSNDAQCEIRQYAETIYHRIFKVMLPITAAAFELYRLNKSITT